MPEAAASPHRSQARARTKPMDPRLAAGIARAVRIAAYRLTAAMAASVIVGAVSLVPTALGGVVGTAGTAGATAIASGPFNTGCCGPN